MLFFRSRHQCESLLNIFLNVRTSCSPTSSQLNLRALLTIFKQKHFLIPILILLLSWTWNVSQWLHKYSQIIILKADNDVVGIWQMAYSLIIYLYIQFLSNYVPYILKFPIDVYIYILALFLLQMHIILKWMEKCVLNVDGKIFSKIMIERDRFKFWWWVKLWNVFQKCKDI